MAGITWVDQKSTVLFPLVLLASLMLALLYGKNHIPKLFFVWSLAGTAFSLFRDSMLLVGTSPFFVFFFYAVAPFFSVLALGQGTPSWLKKSHGTIILVLGAVPLILGLMGFAPFWILGLLVLANAIVGIGFIFFASGTSANTVPRLLLAASFLVPAAFLFLEPSSAMSIHAYASPLASFLWLIAVLEYGKAGMDEIIKDRDESTQNVDALYELVLLSSETLRDSDGHKRFMDNAARITTHIVGGDSGILLMVDGFEDFMAVQGKYGNFPPFSAIPEETGQTIAGIQDWLGGLKVQIGEGIIGETAQYGQAILIPDAASDPRIISIPAFPISSMMSLPLIFQDQVIGAMLIVRTNKTSSFTVHDLARASLVSNYASLVVNTLFSVQDVAERSDIDIPATIALDMQREIRPKRMPQVLPFGTGVFTSSAKGVCSDYFDAIALRKDRVYLIMGDIAGKGVKAVMMMAMIRAILHVIAHTDKDPSVILSWVNRGITGKMGMNHFATLQIVAMNPLTGACEYANAGHQAPLIWKDALGLVDLIEQESVPIGVDGNKLFGTTTFTLEKGDILLLYTDGVIETINASGRQFGVKGLTSTLHAFHDLHAQDVALKIQDALKTYMGSSRQHDDQTVLVVGSCNGGTATTWN